jgi:hypothetical protein
MIKSTIPCRMMSATCVHAETVHSLVTLGFSYLGHYGTPILALYVAEWHLCALVLVDFELWMVDERNLVDGYCA